MLDISYKNILKVALPMMLSGFIQSIISITDAGYLGHYSQLAFEAAGGASMWYITLYMLFVGLNDGSQILMARKIGEKDTKGFISIFQNNTLLLLFVAILVTTVVFLIMPSVMDAMVKNPELRDAEQRFLEIRSFGYWPTIVTLSIQATYLAEGRTKLVLYTAAITASTNALFGYLLVFGKFGFPEMGLEGAALGSACSEFCGMLFIFGTVLYRRKYTEYRLYKHFKLQTVQLKENLKVGLPLLMQGLVALAVWTVFFNWIEQMGGDNLSVSLNIRYIYFLAFIPVWGFAAATKTYIAQYLGAKEYHLLPTIQRRIQLMTVLFLVVTFHGAVLYPEFLVSMVNSNPVHIQKSAVILQMVSGSILLYAIVSVYFQTISASENTRVTFLVECLATASYLTTAYLFIKVYKFQIKHIWLVEYVYFIVMGAASLFYLRFFNWTKKEVL
jgi:putative MATE family efflux protein